MKGLYFPVFMDLSEKKIVVIGGGKIAQRRVKTLLEFAGEILVAAPEITKELKQYVENKEIAWLKAIYHKAQLEGADIVLAATDDPRCNEQIVSDCKEKGILVNTAHRKELCDFYFPAIIRQNDIVAGITACGISHKKVKETRQYIEQALINMDK